MDTRSSILTSAIDCASRSLDARMQPSIGALGYDIGWPLASQICGKHRHFVLRLGHKAKRPALGCNRERGCETSGGGPAERASHRDHGPAPGERQAVPAPLPLETRVRVVAALCEGNSIRATARMIGVDKETVMVLALRVGEGCARLHNRMMRDIAAHVIQIDEMWSYIQKKEARVTEKDPAEHGSAYLFVAIDANTKLAISFHVGKREDGSTWDFVADLRSRLSVVPHVTSDGWQPYIAAINRHFGGAVDYGQCVKHYSRKPRRDDDHRYEPPRDPFITKTPISGAPRDELMSTSYVERFNLTTRHTVGRTRRLCLAFSKTIRGHRAAVALGICYYNFVKLHGTLETTPAVAARLVQSPWTLAALETAALAEGETAPPEPQPLKLQVRPGATEKPARELPGGRGFLRLV
ncbi:IS1 family transposase [Sorangium sp. So ce513]|uniref:IS1 family transposase n=1 Tax=Sorangium sp. So ce513 TaxID=3133315 RepID=UPI003F5D6610